jgi:hypothetical protein
MTASEILAPPNIKKKFQPSRSRVFVTVDGGGAFQTCRTKVSVPHIDTELLCCYYCEEWQIAIMLE